MSEDELPRAYARAASSSSSTSTSSNGELRSVSPCRRTRKRYTSPGSSSSSSSKSVKRTAKQRQSRKRRRNSSSSTRSRSTSRPMWPRKQENRSPSPKSSSSSSSDDSRPEKPHRHRSASRHRSIWMPQKRVGTKHGQADRSDQLYEPRPVTSEWTRKTYACECGEHYGSQKALAHHILQNHNAEIPCFGCNKILSSLAEMLEHFQTVHKKNLVACVYCKSVFGKAGDMTENQWKRLKTHMYGELVYAKLAELQG
ncbi:hypothetical protein RB195_008640 [Necator americanus]